MFILVGLFAAQPFGTAKVAALFGPIMLVWFIVLGLGGLVHIIDDPSVFYALNPWHGIRFLAVNGMAGVWTLGFVFLAVTGAEALYADLGHFGRKPIQTAWLAIVLPALTLNYLGQGALVLARSRRAQGCFYNLYPSWALVPMLLLATVRHRHRQPGGDHRHILADAAGDTARPGAALQYRSTPPRPWRGRSIYRASTGS